MRNFIHTVRERLPAPLRPYLTVQILVYILVGGFTTGLDFFLYWALVEFLGVLYLFSAAVITPFTTYLNFALHRRLTFKSRSARRQQIPRFVLLWGVNYILGLTLLWAFVDGLEINYLIGRIMVFAVIFLWNFTALRLFVFRHTSEV